MIRSAHFALLIAALLYFPHSMDHAWAREKSTGMITIPRFVAAQPEYIYTIRGEAAKSLAHELIPVVDAMVSEVAVHQILLLPGYYYKGILIDLKMTADISHIQSVCEERHLIIIFEPTQDTGLPSPTELSVQDGRVSGHYFRELYYQNRYRTLASVPLSEHAERASCRSLSNDSSSWLIASDASTFAGRIRREENLLQALKSLPMKSIRCHSISATPCPTDRNRLASMIKIDASTRSHEIHIPDEGSLAVYQHYGYGSDPKVDYTVKLQSDRRGVPLSLDITISDSAPPAAI